MTTRINATARRRCKCGQPLQLFDAVTEAPPDPETGAALAVWAATAEDVRVWWQYIADRLGPGSTPPAHDVQAACAVWHAAKHERGQDQEHDQFTEDNAVYNAMIGESLRLR